MTRKIMESVVLKMADKDGTEKKVVVKVIDVGKGKVRLGFDAEPDVTILRQELNTKPPSPSLVAKA